MGAEEKENFHLILFKISVVLFRTQEQKVKNVRKEKDGPMRDSDARTICRTRGVPDTHAGQGCVVCSAQQPVRWTEVMS